MMIWMRSRQIWPTSRCAACRSSTTTNAWWASFHSATSHVLMMTRKPSAVLCRAFPSPAASTRSRLTAAAVPARVDSERQHMARSTTYDQASSQRDRMVDVQIARRGVRDRHVLDAMRKVPREAFVGEGLEEFAYEDAPLPIEEGQTISQPYIVALMTEAAEVKPGDRVLDVGTGSGYAAAVLSRIAGEVYAIERHHALVETAKRRFEQLGYNNIHVRHGDGTLGWREAAPFDAIIVAAGGPEIPEVLQSQLKIGGRLVIPIGLLEHEQRLVKVVREGEHEFHEEDLGPVMFVPLIGAHGWSDAAMRSPHEGTEAPRAPPARQRSPADLIRAAPEPLRRLDDPAFGRRFDRFADAR